jgi:hypothetical protein
MSSVPGISMAGGAPISLYINVSAAGAGVVAVNISISSTTPGPFAWYPISTGIGSYRTYINGFCGAFGYIIVCSTRSK